MKSFLKIQDLNTNELLNLVDKALEFKSNKNIVPLEKIVANLFFENSTRTKNSFEMAALKLGLKCINFDSATSSLSKGESMFDTCKCFESLGVDALIIRTKDDEIDFSLDIPIINAGSGKNHHPSQSLLDLITIYENFKDLSRLKVAIVGDIAHSRVAKSNKAMFDKLGIKTYFCAPLLYQNKDFIFNDFDEIIDEIDVLIMLRVQNERHEKSDVNNLSMKDFSLNEQRLKRLKDNAIIMHPGPVNWGVEICANLANHKKMRINTQVKNGVFARMAILDYCLRG